MLNRQVYKILDGQDWQLDLMELLGYQIIDREGHCFGVGQMGKQAFFLGQFDVFLARYELLSHIHEDLFSSPNQFPDFDSYNKHKSEVMKKIKNMDLDERHALLKNAIKKYIKDKPEKEFTNILGLFDGIYIYQNVGDLSYLFDPTKPDQIPQYQDATLTLPLTVPILLDKETIMNVNYDEPFTASYTENELSGFFARFKTEVENYKNNRVALTLGSNDHSIMIAYDAKKNRWNVIDANRLSIYEANDFNALAKIVIEALDGAEVVNFSADVSFSSGDNKNDFKQKLTDWLQAEREINSTEENIQTKKDKLDNSNSSWLYVAAKTGDVDMVDKIIAKDVGKIINLKTTGGFTPIFVPAQKGFSTIVKKLIAAKADVNLKDDQELTPLHYAAMSGDVETIKVLIEAGAIIDAQNKDGVTPLIIAIKMGHFEATKKFIELNAQINLSEKYGNTPLHYSAVEGNPLIIQELIKAGAELNAKNHLGRTPLFRAAAAGKLENVKVLLANHANINSYDNKGNTPLHASADEGNPLITQELIKAGAEINATNDRRRTPLYLAAAAGKLENVKVLLANHANINQYDKYGATPLFAAAKNGHLDVVDYLLKNQANAILPAVIKYSEFLKLAAETKTTQNFLDFLKRQNITITDPTQEILLTPLDIAIILGKNKIAERLSSPKNLYLTKSINLLNQLKNNQYEVSFFDRTKIDDKHYPKFIAQIIKQLEIQIENPTLTEKDYASTVALLTDQLKPLLAAKKGFSIFNADKQPNIEFYNQLNKEMQNEKALLATLPTYQNTSIS